MGNNSSTNSNEIQELINGIRRKAGENQTLKSLNQNLETATKRNHGEILQNMKLNSISEVIKTDDLETFKEVEKEEGLNVIDPIGRLQLTPLHLAAYHQSFNILKYLLNLPNIPINSTTQDGDTPLNLGLFGAQSDDSAIEIIRLFLSNKSQKVNIFCKNHKKMFPLLITVQKKFAGASTFLLTSPSKEIIDNYETWDIVHVIKLAIITNQDRITDLIHKNLGAFRRVELLEKVKDKGNQQFEDLVDLLERTLITDKTSSTVMSAEFKTARSKASQENGSNTQELVLPSVPKQTVKKLVQVQDATGNILRVGNIVQTLTAQFVQKALAPIYDVDQSSSDVEKVAEKFALIHGIYGNMIYIEIQGAQFVTRMLPEATVLHAEGVTEVISDGSSVRIGSYVQVLANEADLKRVAGTGAVGWLHGMEETCGRTGKIVRFLRNSDILVQFPWGPRYFMKPKALLQSSSDKLQTKDARNNWIEAGSIIQIKKSLKEFMYIQNKNNLPYEGNYANLPFKFALVKAIQLTAFSPAKNLQISFNGRPYFVNVDCIELVNSVKDANNEDVRVGNNVQVVNDKDKLKLLHNGKVESESDFGGWVKEMDEIVGEVGMVTEIFCDDRIGLNALVIKVKFSRITSFYLNPRAIEKYTGTVVPKANFKVGPNDVSEWSEYSEQETIQGEFATVATEAMEEINLVQEEDWEKVDRNNLTCFEVLGQGGFGCVVRGEWKTRDGSKKVVAIKQVNFGKMNGAGPLQDVMAEAKIQFSLRHPNIVSLFGISLDRDLWIIMDFVDGQDLFNILAPHDGSDLKYSFDKKLALCLDMCNAIAYIHQKGYIHCDVKPHNMMVDAKEKLYVCDFGITQFLGMDRMSFATQYTNEFGGTLYYIPPECVQEDENTGKYRKPTFAADIWALGATFYEIFTRLHLYDNHMKLLNDKIESNDKIIKRRMGDLPESVRTIVSRALDFNRSARPSAQELSEFFHELIISRTAAL